MKIYSYKLPVEIINAKIVLKSSFNILAELPEKIISGID